MTVLVGRGNSQSATVAVEQLTFRLAVFVTAAVTDSDTQSVSVTVATM